MTDLYTVEVSLCADCIFDVGHQCENRSCDTWKAQARRKSRQVIRNMLATAQAARLAEKARVAVAETLEATGTRLGPSREWLRQQSIQAGLKR